MTDHENKATDTETIVNLMKSQKERALQALAARYDKVLADLQELGLDSPLEVNVNGMSRQSDAVEPISIQAGEFHNLSYTKAAKAILEKIRKPQTTQEILMFFEKSGRKIPGKNPPATLYSSLKKSDDFDLVARNTWGLSEWYGKKRKGVAERTLEIMGRGPISFNEASEQAFKESKKEKTGS